MADTNAAGLETSLSSLNSVDNDTSVPSSANQDTQPSKWTSASTSLAGSPVQSRDPSPSRTAKVARRTSSGSVPASSGRDGVRLDPSPSRTRSNIPTPFPAPRSQLLSAAKSNLPLPSGSEVTTSRAPVPQKSSVASEASKDAPRWPVSPRLKSPPPSFTRPTAASSARRNEPEPPLINVQRATPSPHVESISLSASDIEAEEAHLSSGMRTPSRGPSICSSILETVQEVSQPNTPQPSLDAALRRLEETATSQEEARNKNPDPTSGSVVSSQHPTNSDSGSDSGSVKTNTRRSSSVAPPPPLHTRQSSSALKFGRGQTSGESSSRNMTVETEQVNNIARLSLAPKESGKGPNGSLRTRPSTETIKPKKDRKKPTRKPAGNASSKADIFEAKVASAVEEADSSDSDETFVYDSNPPDAERPRRFHSRTPSAASMVSQLDRNGMRSIHAVLEGVPQNAPVKKNMKFVNTHISTGNEAYQGEDDGRGTGRSNVGSTRGTARHYHPGRWGRNNGSNHPSLFDNESPFPNATRSKFSSGHSNKTSNPSSPRFATANRGWLSGGKQQGRLTNGFDMDDAATTGADDEQTPLLQPSLIRSPRSGRGRRVPLRNLESQTYRQNPSFLNRFASCLVLTVMLLLVVTGAIGFMFATSQPLTDVQLLKIGNVLASEQELMFDLTVRAHNPNVVVVMIDSADLEVFAKSPHAGTDSEWWRHPQDDDFVALDDPKNDPPKVGEPSDGESSPVMRLGNIHSFDSPLTYEGSFFQRSFTTSAGELRLARPGNSTDSGTERWERIIADEFTLVIKGVLKYTLPLSQKIRKVPISGKTLVKPNAANDPALQPNREKDPSGVTTWAA